MTTLEKSYEGKVLDIATDDDPCLKLVANPVIDIKSGEVKQLIADMIKTMYEAPGIGLAAPQVRQSLRILVFYLPAARDKEFGVGVPLTVLINPVIRPLCDEKNVDFEGCLSVPGFRGKVARYNSIEYEGYTASGEFIRKQANGWHARVVQHEFDHLNGVLYPELMAEEEKMLTVDEWKALTTPTN